ncbi:MAG TPA: TRAM domain-containing protein [Acidimicrobiales bacterium]|nr:TRAM domain-containing protein [Acidimicrobiales bacterium]
MATQGSDDLLELEVGALAGGGGCVARATDGKVVFVRHAIPGERVRARVTAATKSYLRADAVEILGASPDRVDPPCPHAGPGRCGGCDFQHIEVGVQRRLKATRVEELLRQIAGMEREIEVEAVVGVEGGRDGLGWRTRVRLAVDGSGRAGFRRHRSHRVERVEACPVTTAQVGATGALAATWPGVTEIEVLTGVPSDEAVLAVTPRRGPGAPRLPAVRGGLVFRGKVRRDPGAVHMQVRGQTYRVSSGVFWQAHVGAAEALLAAVLGLIGDVDLNGATAADLYSGAGLFAVALADAVGADGSVVAVERDRRACADARHNAGGRAHLLVEQTEVTPALVATGIGRPSVVVLDPAREGAGIEVMQAFASHTSTLRRLVYISCDAATFARDVHVLLDVGWTMPSLRTFDIFPMTEHVELVAGLEPPGA